MSHDPSSSDGTSNDSSVPLLSQTRSHRSHTNTPFVVPPPSPVVAGFTTWCENSQAPHLQNPQLLTRSSSLWHDLSIPLPTPWMHSGGLPSAHLESDREDRSCWQFFKYLSKTFGLCCFRSPCIPKIFPCVSWLLDYHWRQDLLVDMLAGISVAVMLIPQAMSYASIAGLPHVYGLYGSLSPVIAYAIFGSSKHLAVGPAAVTSLLISNGLRTQVPGYIEANISNPNELQPGQEVVQEAYNHRAIQLSMLVGFLYSSLGLLRLGFLTNFFSHSVISGFTSGSALIIALTQMKYFLGYQIQASPVAQQQIRRYWEKSHLFRWQELVMGCGLLAVILTMKTLGKRHAKLRWLRPLGPVTCCLLGKLLVWAGDLGEHGIATMGNIDGGLPKATMGWWFPLLGFDDLLPLAGVVMLVDLMESTSIARALSHKTGQNLNSNQEIVGLGVANLVGAACNSYTTTGSFSRSAVNYDAGAKTQISGVFSALTVLFFVAFGADWFRGMPKNAIGAVVVNSVTGLFEFDHAVHLFKVDKLDWVVWMCSFLTTMFVGVEVGLVISITLALLIVIYHSALPHTAILGRIPNSRVYRNIVQYPHAVQIPGMLICRIDAPIYFANIAYIQDRLHDFLESAQSQANSTGCRLHVVAIDLSPVTNIDAAGVRFFHELVESIHDMGTNLALCNPSTAVVAAFERGKVLRRLGRRWVFVRVHDAVLSCRRSMRGVDINALADVDDTEDEEEQSEVEGEGQESQLGQILEAGPIGEGYEIGPFGAIVPRGAFWATRPL